LTDDVLPRFTKKGCEYEQLALYDPESGQLQIDAEIYNSPHFSRTDAAALWLHEAIYKLDRFLNKTENSREARKLTAMLFMETPPLDLVEAFDKRLGQYALSPNAKVLWVDANQEVQVDVITENTPNDIICRFSGFRKDANWFTISSKKTFYPKFFSIEKMEDGKLDPWLNGFTPLLQVRCSNERNVPTRIEKMKFTATFTQAGRQILKVNFSKFHFEFKDPLQFHSDDDLIDQDPNPWVVRFL
jgi:hypothetical protein